MLKKMVQNKKIFLSIFLIGSIIFGCLLFLSKTTIMKNSKQIHPLGPQKSSISINSPSGINYGRDNISLTYQNTTTLDTVWFNIDGGNNITISGNYTINLTNPVFGVNEDGSHQLNLYANATNGTLYYQSSIFTVYSFNINSVINNNNINGINASFIRYNASGLDSLNYSVDSFTPLVSIPENTTSFLFNTSYISTQHSLEIIGYNQSENYTYRSNKRIFSNIGFLNASGANVAIIITPNMPDKLTEGSVASFKIKFDNTGSVPLTTVYVHLAAMDEQGNIIVQKLGGYDLPLSSSIEYQFSFVLSKDYDQIIVPFNVTANEFIIENVIAFYDPSDPWQDFLDFLNPWGWIMFLGIGSAIAIASLYRTRLVKIKRKEKKQTKKAEAERTRRILAQRKETDKFLEKQKPILDLQTEVDDYGAEVPIVGPDSPQKKKKKKKKKEPYTQYPEKIKQASSEKIQKTIAEEKEIAVEVKKDKCIVHAGVIKGASYICPECAAKYCLKCAMTLKNNSEGCWQCKTPIDL